MLLQLPLIRWASFAGAFVEFRFKQAFRRLLLASLGSHFTDIYYIFGILASRIKSHNANMDNASTVTLFLDI